MALAGVLVVDDDFMVADIHRRFVDRTDGFRAVGVAHTAAAALEAATELRPDLILLDVHLPDGSGLDVLRALRADSNAVDVIMITAARELDTVSTALSGGAADYLIKPFEYTNLRDKLEAYLSRRKALSSDRLDQGVVDTLFGRSNAAAERARLPKGMSAETGKSVLDVITPGIEVSASECADLVGISRVSARRYLEHYLTHEVLDIRLQYGKAGRPERLYRRR